MFVGKYLKPTKQTDKESVFQSHETTNKSVTSYTTLCTAAKIEPVILLITQQAQWSM